MRDIELYELLLSEPMTQEERCKVIDGFVESRNGELDDGVAEELASWILFGVKDLSVKLQIELRGYIAERDSGLTS